MGVCQSKEVRAAIARNTEIDHEMENDPAQTNIKLLLLGAGECGKSTILKQMQILHLDGFTEQEIVEKKAIIYGNIITSMATILQAMEDLKIAFEDPEREIDSKIVLQVIADGNEKNPLEDQISLAIKQLWSDKGIIETHGRRNEYQLPDCARYFFDEIDRIRSHSFWPNNQDILQSRVATLGIVEVNFTSKQTMFKVFDVGGQRSERRKWIHCFDNVQAVIFIISLSEYDQVLQEDATRVMLRALLIDYGTSTIYYYKWYPHKNRMKESIELFKSILVSQWFAKASMILFLNKKDLFAEKIMYSPITTVFPEYVGPQAYDRCLSYIEEKYKMMNSLSPMKKALYSHVTCATDTNQVQIVLDSVLDMIIQKNIERSGMD